MNISKYTPYIMPLLIFIAVFTIISCSKSNGTKDKEEDINEVPVTATLLSPQQGVKITPTNGTVTLEWKISGSNDGTITFTIYADTVDGNQQSPTAWQNLTANSFEISVVSGTTYYWRIETSNGNQTTTSETYTFETHTIVGDKIVNTSEGILNAISCCTWRKNLCS